MCEDHSPAWLIGHGCGPVPAERQRFSLVHQFLWPTPSLNLCDVAWRIIYNSGFKVAHFPLKIPFCTPSNPKISPISSLLQKNYSFRFPSPPESWTEQSDNLWKLDISFLIDLLFSESIKSMSTCCTRVYHCWWPAKAGKVGGEASLAELCHGHLHTHRVWR